MTENATGGWHAVQYGESLFAVYSFVLPSERDKHDAASGSMRQPPSEPGLLAEALPLAS